MKRVTLPDDKTRPLAFFLAMEEWVTEHLPAESDYIFVWKVEPTVIIGHNQDMKSEVNVPYCRKNNIDIVRRRSGGGCVYADLDNIMVSYVAAGTDIQEIFKHYTAMMASQLRKLGLDAQPSGRNDIVVGPDGRKISGNASYILNGRTIVHGTMLYDSDLNHILKAITPSRAKLESHKVKSVEARIITAKSLLPSLSSDEFTNGLTQGLFTGELTLSAAEILEIEKIEQRYYHPEWVENSKLFQSNQN